MGFRIKINPSDTRQAVKETVAGALPDIGDSLAVLMSFQIDRAFREGGQPSTKWPAINPPQPSKPVPDSQVLRKPSDQPLRATGDLQRSFEIPESHIEEGRLVLSIASASAIASFHQEGFSTTGPNYIPITRKGRLLHRPGANPKDEGLVQGVDYIIAFNGVTVPARPMIDYGDPVNLQEIRDTINEIIGG